MILTSLRAENVLKYERLVLEHLPAQGVVAISGYNESGKSSIGETICFALFGRTFSLDPAHIAKIVRWGETRCSVSVAFRVGDTDYRLTRALDKDGNHSARLSRLGEVSIVVWRSVSTAMLRSLVHPLLLGRLGLRALFLIENLAPRFFGRHGAYSTILIAKPGAGSLAPEGERR